MTQPDRPRRQRRSRASRRVVRPAPVLPRRKAADDLRIATQDTLTQPIDSALRLLRAGGSDADIRAALRRSGFSRFESRRVDRAIRAAGIDIHSAAGRDFSRRMKALLSEEELEEGDEEAEAELAKWGQEVRDLMRKVRKQESQRLQQLEKLIGDRTRLRAELTKARGIVRRRVRTIARDQNEKLVGREVELRQRAGGIDSYVWVTREDDRVRPSHMALHGSIRTWRQRPRPGEPINCRCVAVPNIRA